MHKPKIIKFNQSSYLRSFWKVPYLVWFNNLDDNFNSLIKSLYPDYEPVELDDDDEDEQNSFWDLEFLEDGSELNNDSIEIQNKLFDEYVDQFIKYYQNKNNIDHKKVKYVSLKQNTEGRSNQTLEFYKSKDVDLIVNPVFSKTFNIKNNEVLANASFPLYDKINKKIIMLSFSSTSKMETAFKAKFYFDLLRDLNIPVDNISLVLQNPYPNSIIKKGKVDFIETYSCRTVQSKKVSDNKFVDALFNSGDVLWKDEYTNQPATFLTFCKNSTFHKSFGPTTKKADNQLGFNLMWSKTLFSEEKIESMINVINMPNYKNVIEQTIDFYIDSFEKNTALKIKDYLREKELSNDYTNQTIGSSFSFCTSDNNLESKIKKHLFTLYYGNIYGDYSTNLYRQGLKDKLAKSYHFINGNYSSNNEYVLECNSLFNKQKNWINFHALNIIKKIHVKNARTIWYDYEGFSSPIPLIDNLGGHKQLINQVSIIETINGRTTNIINTVVDPLKELKLVNLAKVLISIYSEKATNYVVFNKSYENTRNEEMLKLIKQNYFSDFNNSETIELKEYINSIGGIEKFENIVMWINNNTIDLAQCFQISTKIPGTDSSYSVAHFFDFDNDKIIDKGTEKDSFNLIKLQLIFLKELKYKYSIKKIEKLITKQNLDLKTKITPYSELVVKNGSTAMAEAIARYAGITGDNVWNDTCVNLKKYCENDVKAMIMVYEFIMFLFRSTGFDVDKYEYQLLDENLEYALNEQNKLIIQ
ncbi:UU173 family protein [Mycoplasma crocodyli]|uniref:DUF2779 domain-containing protein n=1 Tax=Mycoplasma crocodyli (strain ATCC 51981 / MP145) TaxID=512564 RepID=D5E558_MYCCM|nr:DUF2779 domain-containing protein [Mycoplasma crocodyli]ADE20015.1 hypothetical protein MCRO_0249 [Mycoplasma crocodyli MP145]